MLYPDAGDIPFSQSILYTAGISLLGGIITAPATKALLREFKKYNKH
jgi:hypothetical protein